MNPPTVCFYYLVPAGQALRNDYLTAVTSAVLDVQRWYWQQLQDGTSFRISNPVVQVIQTARPDWWYAENQAGDQRTYWFWQNTLQDGYTRSGIHPDDQTVSAVFYVDASHAPGQIGGAGLQRRAVLHRGDLEGLIGQGDRGICRWVGGLAHELGHVFGLDHPQPCQNQQLAEWEAPCQSLMYLGYLNYPRTNLLPEDLAILRRNPFFGPVTPDRSAGLCTGTERTTVASGRGRETSGRRVAG